MYLFPVSPFLILEASVVLSGLLKREKATASAPWAEPKGPDAAPGRLASCCWGRGKEVLLAPPFAPAQRLQAGRSACAVTWTSGACAGSSAEADTRCANPSE